VIYLLP